MIVVFPYRLIAHGMENVGAWNIGSMGEITDIFHVVTHLLADDGVIILIGIMSSLLHLITTSFTTRFADLWKVIGSQAVHCTTSICVQEDRKVCMYHVGFFLGFLFDGIFVAKYKNVKFSCLVYMCSSM